MQIPPLSPLLEGFELWGTVGLDAAPCCIGSLKTYFHHTRMSSALTPQYMWRSLRRSPPTW